MLTVGHYWGCDQPREEGATVLQELLSQSVDRPQIALAALTLSPSSAGIVRAATDASGFSRPGCQELKVTSTDTAFEGGKDAV